MSQGKLIEAQGKLINNLFKEDCQCNLTNVENSIRENGIAIAENTFVIGIHRDRINETQENIQIIQNNIDAINFLLFQ